MKGINEKWVNLILWVCAYLSIVGFILVGGYSWINGNEKIKKEVKLAAIVKLIFVGVFIALSVAQNILILAGGVSNAFVMVLTCFALVETLVFCVFAVIAFFKKEVVKSQACVVECCPKKVENINDK